MKIKVITPVHIGTGNSNYPFEYHRSRSSCLDYYGLYNVLQTFPPEKLLDERMLNLLNRSNVYNAKQQLNDIFRRYANYTHINKLYSCEIYNDIDNYDVFEQVKNLYEPIIPGSSLKGTLLTAIYYTYIKDHHSLFCEKVEAYLRESKRDLNKTELYLSMVLGKDLGSTEKFIKLVSSCLLCSDISFEKIGIYKSERITCKGKEIPQGYLECINPIQEKSGKFFSFDHKDIRLKNIVRKEEKEFLEYFRNENIIRSCKIYFEDMMKEEVQSKIKQLYSEYNSINILNNRLITSSKQMDDKSCYIRIGKGTNYFFKSISLLIKEKMPEFYEKNFVFNFSPLGRRGEKKLDPKTMPTTRVILKGWEYTLSGFVELKLDD